MQIILILTKYLSDQAQLLGMLPKVQIVMVCFTALFLIIKQRDPTPIKRIQNWFGCDDDMSGRLRYIFQVGIQGIIIARSEVSFLQQCNKLPV